MKDSIYKEYLTNHPFYSKNLVDFSGSFRFFDKNYLKFLPTNKNARILDIGCGTGHFLAFLKSRGYRNILGIDVSKEQIEHTKKYITKKVLLISNLAKFLKNKKKSFDFILMNDVIEHLEKEEIINLLSLIQKSLKNNAVVVIRTVNLKNRWGMAVRYMDFTHTTGFTEESLRQVMGLAGFRNIKLVNEIHPVHDLRSLVRVFLKYVFEFFYRVEYLASFGDFSPMLSNMLIAIGKR